MWQLKFEYAHRDCLYSQQLKKLKLVMYGYPLNHYVAGRKLYLQGMQIIKGEEKDVQRYVRYLKKRPAIKQLEQVSAKVILFQTVISSNLPYYQNLYNPKVFYLSPIIHHQGQEIFEIASWEREVLSRIMKNIMSNRNTSSFKLHYLKRTPLSRIFLPQLLPKLTEKQRKVLSLAQERGYWHYPRKIDLNQLAKELKLAKSTVHETLKRAEARLLEYYI